MVEVFKTNVKYRSYADKLIQNIHRHFSGYSANFDLEDRDYILRVACDSGIVKTSLLINFLKRYGFTAEALPDHGNQ